MSYVINQTFFVIRDCTIMKSASTRENIPAEYDTNSNENIPGVKLEKTFL